MNCDRPARVAHRALGPRGQLVVVEDVVEREHPLGVLDRGEQRGERAADVLRRASRACAAPGTPSPAPRARAAACRTRRRRRSASRARSSGTDGRGPRRLSSACRALASGVGSLPAAASCSAVGRRSAISAAASSSAAADSASLVAGTLESAFSATGTSVVTHLGGTVAADPRQFRPVASGQTPACRGPVGSDLGEPPAGLPAGGERRPRVRRESPRPARRPASPPPVAAAASAGNPSRRHSVRTRSATCLPSGSADDGGSARRRRRARARPRWPRPADRDLCSNDRSRATAAARASRKTCSGTSGAQQCTTTGTPDRLDHRAQRGRRVGPRRPRGRRPARSRSAPCPPAPPAATARRAGAAGRPGAAACGPSSTWPAQPLGERVGQVADRARVAQQPPADRQVDARRQGPRAGRLQLERCRRYPSPCSVSWSRSRSSRSAVRRRSLPGRGADLPAARRRAAPAARPGSPALRPIRSAPGPRSGSSGRCGRSGSSPKTIRCASAMSVPGSEPIPVAAPAGHGKSLTGRSRRRRPGPLSWALPATRHWRRWWPSRARCRPAGSRR